MKVKNITNGKNIEVTLLEDTSISTAKKYNLMTVYPKATLIQKYVWGQQDIERKLKMVEMLKVRGINVEAENIGKYTAGISAPDYPVEVDSNGHSTLEDILKNTALLNATLYTIDLSIEGLGTVNLTKAEWEHIYAGTPYAQVEIPGAVIDEFIDHLNNNVLSERSKDVIADLLEYSGLSHFLYVLNDGNYDPLVDVDLMERRLREHGISMRRPRATFTKLALFDLDMPEEMVDIELKAAGVKILIPFEDFLARFGV